MKSIETNELMLREVIENNNGGPPGVLQNQILPPRHSLVGDNSGFSSRINDTTFPQTLPMGDLLLDQQTSREVQPVASENQQPAAAASVANTANYLVVNSAVNNYLSGAVIKEDDVDEIKGDVKTTASSSCSADPKIQDALPPLGEEDNELEGGVPAEREEVPTELPPVVEYTRIESKGLTDEVQQQSGTLQNDDQSDGIMDKVDDILAMDRNICNTGGDDDDKVPDQIHTEQEKTSKELDVSPPVEQDKDAGATHQFRIPRGKLGFVIKGEKHTISKVFSHSPLHRIVMEGTDELVSIEGTDVRKMALDEVKTVTENCFKKSKSQFPHMVIGINRTSSITNEKATDVDDSKKPISVTPDKDRSEADDEAEKWLDSIFVSDVAGTGVNGSATKVNLNVDSPVGKGEKRIQPSEAMAETLKNMAKDKSSSKGEGTEPNKTYMRRWAGFCKFVDESADVRVKKTADGSYLTRENVDEFFTKNAGEKSLSVYKQNKQALQWYAQNVENKKEFDVNSLIVERAVKKRSSRGNTAENNPKRKALQNNSNSNKKAKMASVAKQKTSTGTKTAKKISDPQNARLEWEGEPPEVLEGGWPPGWTKRIYRRINSKDHKDPYWYSPDKTHKFNTIKKTKEFLKRTQKTGKNKTSIKIKASTKKDVNKKVTMTKIKAPTKKVTKLGPQSYQLHWAKFCSFVDGDLDSKVKKTRDGRYLTRVNIDKFFEMKKREGMKVPSGKQCRGALQWYANNVEFPSSNKKFDVNSPIVQQVTEEIRGTFRKSLETSNGSKRNVQRHTRSENESAKRSAVSNAARPKTYVLYWKNFCSFVDESTDARIRKTVDGRYLTRVNVDEYFKMLGEDGTKGPSTLTKIKSGLQWYAANVEFQPSRGSEFMVDSATVAKYAYTKSKGFIVASRREKCYFKEDFAEISTKNITPVTRGVSTRNRCRAALSQSSGNTRKVTPKDALERSSKDPRNDQGQSEYDRLREENERMKEQKNIEDLRKENEELWNSNERLRRESAKLRQQHAKLQEDLIDSLRHENERLKNQNIIEKLNQENEKLRGERLMENLTVENKSLRINV